MAAIEPVGNAGRTVIITGAGSGIGRAMALGFAATGARVLVADLVPARVDESCALIERAGGTASGCVVDVRVAESVGQMVTGALAAWGHVDVLCNNAGIMDMMQPAGTTSDAVWHDVLRTNLDGVMFATRAVLPAMLQAGRGVIINTASGAGLRGGAAGAAYTASKHGVIGLTKNTAYSYGRQGIRCVAICPGGVHTNIDGGKGFAAFDPAGLQVCEPVLRLAGRMAQPEDIAAVAVFLASDAAGFINGAIVPVDDGWSAG